MILLKSRKSVKCCPFNIFCDICVFYCSLLLYNSLLRITQPSAFALALASSRLLRHLTYCRLSRRGRRQNLLARWLAQLRDLSRTSHRKTTVAEKVHESTIRCPRTAPEMLDHFIMRDVGNLCENFHVVAKTRRHC